jgi:glycosyltransferase involved in cell wall biosynthesis
MEKPKLSILIPAIPSRFGRAQNLYNRLNSLVGDLPVEILMFMDNKRRSIGKKRDTLVSMANGDYVAFLDDDDSFFDNYITDLLKGCESGADVITFKQMCTLDGKSFIVDFDLNHTENEEAQMIDGEYININRRPFHICAWKSEIAKKSKFADVGYGEDWDWCRRLLTRTKTQYKIDNLVHHYVFDSSVTEAPVESNAVWVNPNN